MPLYSGPIEPLKKTANGWAPTKDDSLEAKTKKTIQSILNKMTREKVGALILSFIVHAARPGTREREREKANSGCSSMGWGCLSLVFVPFSCYLPRVPVFVSTVWIDSRLGCVRIVASIDVHTLLMFHEWQGNGKL